MRSLAEAMKVRVAPSVKHDSGHVARSPAYLGVSEHQYCDERRFVQVL
jgi:hypothetical protein